MTWKISDWKKQSLALVFHTKDFFKYSQMIMKKQKKSNIFIIDEVHTLYLWGIAGKDEEAFRAEFGQIDRITSQLEVGWA